MNNTNKNKELLKPSSWKANRNALNKIKTIPIKAFYVDNGDLSKVHYKKRGTGELTSKKLHQYLGIKLMRC